MKHVRNLAEDSWENTDAESVASEDSMDVSISGDKVHIRRPGKYYRNQVTFKKDLNHQRWVYICYGKFNEIIYIYICKEYVHQYFLGKLSSIKNHNQK